MKSMIRLCTKEDVPAMLDMAVLMHQESPVYKDLPLDLVKLENLGNVAMDSPHLATIIVSTTDGQLTGMLGAISTTEYFGPAITTCDLFLYVLPERRGSTAALRLLKKYDQWAVDLGATRINLGITTGLFLAETGRLYEAAGYTHAGHLYTRINPNGHLKTHT